MVWVGWVVVWGGMGSGMGGGMGGDGMGCAGMGGDGMAAMFPPRKWMRTVPN